MRGVALSALILLVHVACALFATLCNANIFVAPAPSDVVRGLVVVGSQRDPRACIGIWGGEAYVVAPAHCLAQMRGGPAEFVDFGFQPTTAPRDSDDGSAALLGTFKLDERIAIERIAYHPRFANASALSSHSATVGVDSTLAEFDWAVIKLQKPRVSNSSKELGIAKLDAEMAHLRLSQSIGILRIDHTSLDVRFVNDTLLLDNSRCALYPSAATAKNFLCAIPRYPEARRDADGRNRSADWNLLIARPVDRDQINALMGFETSNADAAAFTSFTIPDGSTEVFLEQASDKHVVLRGIEVIGGIVVKVTPEIAFISGVRATRAGRNICGGSLVSPTFVLTAAHCLDSVGASLWVSIGSPHGEDDATGEQIKVTRAIRHPGYDKDIKSNDLALLELKYPSIQRPATLASSTDNRARGAEVLGFGTASAAESAPLSPVLLTAAVDIMASRQKCSLQIQFDVDDSMLCAVGKNGADACAGDSGGPLIVRASGGGAPTLVGVVSFGRGCGSGLPGVYADVGRGLAFIASVIRGAGEEMVVPTQAPVRPSSPPASVLPSATPAVPTSPTSTSLPPPELAPASTPAPVTTSVRSAGTPPSGSSPSPQSSSPQLGNLLVSPANHRFEVPSTTPPRVRNALTQFLTGDLSNIVDTQRASKLFDGNAIVFVSTTALGGLEAIVTKYSSKALSQRTQRFQDVSTASSSPLKTQHWVC